MERFNCIAALIFIFLTNLLIILPILIQRRFSPYLQKLYAGESPSFLRGKSHFAPRKPPESAIGYRDRLKLGIFYDNGGAIPNPVQMMQHLQCFVCKQPVSFQLD